MTLIAGFVIINFMLLGTVYSSTCKPFQITKNNLNKALIGHSVREIKDINHQDCARTCMSLSVCKSIDFDRQEDICKLNDADRSSVDPSEIETKKGSIFSDISEWPSTMVGSCSSMPCKANQRCYQKGASHVCKFPWTCKDVKLCSSSYTDGEYWLYSGVLGGHMVKIYCAGMSTEEPLEYISVNEKANYGFNHWKSQFKAVLTRYRKIRVNIMEWKIIRKDTIFSKSSEDKSELPPLPYGTGSSCGCELCALGNFSISLQGTGLKFKKEVEWVTTGWKAKMINFQRNVDSNMISAKCGGNCGQCDPNGNLYIAYNQNDGKLCIFSLLKKRIKSYYLFTLCIMKQKF
ncbi:A disintegrin and metalloproteinase with thrombospondin motifs 20-like isoform X2 [Ruditapes philippinarum]|uniref:A disintegrin and metalloproteinase with thrombospondin motifs 20-like isoform X2 n=1 Tax=Ruditapes philippinarum TaxID=129788 RepID=UPI00295B7987|nr:A disintegrin and metalloproteinase with thrombospondin motifs 20-like isoform X2 [Ruditapes philippinarum]